MTKAKLREKESETCLLLCRHGDTDFPDDHFYLSTTEAGSEGDPSLNAAGNNQADRLGRYLSGLGEISRLYVSPVLRTRQTMEAVQGHLEKDLSLAILPDLMERRMGTWEGRSAEEIKQETPEDWKRWKSEPLTFQPPGGESLEGFGHRLSKAVETIIQKEREQTAVIVTHVGVIRALVAQGMGMPLENGKRLRIHPGSLTRIHYTKSWANLVLLNYQP